MTWLSLLSALRKVPPLAWLLAACAFAICALVYSIGAYGDARYAAGKQDAARNAVFDSTLAATFARQREVVVLRTDTLVQRVTVTRHRVDTLIAALPDSVRQLPSVAPLVVTVQLLTKQVDSLTQQIDTERAAHRMERDVLAAQLRSAAVVIAVQQDSITTLKRRPTWAQADALAVVSAVAGAIVGLLR